MPKVKATCPIQRIVKFITRDTCVAAGIEIVHKGVHQIKKRILMLIVVATIQPVYHIAAYCLIYSRMWLIARACLLHQTACKQNFEVFFEISRQRHREKMLCYAHLVSDITIYEGIKCLEDKKMKIGFKIGSGCFYLLLLPETYIVRYSFLFLIGILLSHCGYSQPAHTGDTVTFAVIGDYGQDTKEEGEVANMVKSWSVDFVITTGDNNYLLGSRRSLKKNIGKYYGDYIYNPTAPADLQCHGKAASDKVNRFFPCPGNHDWYTPHAKPYKIYFGQPMDYDFAVGPVHFFSINSGMNGESDRHDSLQAQLSVVREPFKFVYFHHPPFSPGEHGNAVKMQWPFAQWGADAVLCGHEHFYARINDKTTPALSYFICGSSGNTHLYGCDIHPLDSSRFTMKCDDKHWGAMKVKVTKTAAVFEYYIASDRIHPLDTYIMRK